MYSKELIDLDLSLYRADTCGGILVTGVSVVQEQRKAQLLMAELKNEASVRETSKPCPTCRAALSKTGGCNKVQCALCSAFMCWRCGKGITDYAHFSMDGCILFNDDEVAAWDAEWAAMVRLIHIGCFCFFVFFETFAGSTLTDQHWQFRSMWQIRSVDPHWLLCFFVSNF